MIIEYTLLLKSVQLKKAINFQAKKKLIMSTLEQIKTAILNLSAEEFEQFKQWFLDLDYQKWDKQLEDIAAGKLEALAEEAIAEFKSGHCKKI